MQIKPPFHSTLSNDWFFKAPHPCGVHLLHCTYTIANYHDGLYPESGIPLPEQISTAIAKRKAEHLAGRLCAQKALSCLGIDDLPMFQPSKSPLWPNSSIGSITHSHNIAAAVVANTNNWLALGLDIEQLLSEARCQKLAARIIKNKEMSLSKNDNVFFTTLAFSVKESLFKALFPITKQYFYFHDAEILEWSGDNAGEITLELTVDLSDNWKKGSIIKGLYCLKENYIWSMVSISR